MRYVVKLETDGNGFVASFPDVPEALTGGATREETLAMAKDALVTAMDFYFEDNRPVPLPSKRKGDEYVELPPSLAAKVLLLNAMLEEKVRPADLARLMGVAPQEVTRITNVRHATKIDSVDAALHALGRRLEMQAVPA